MSDRTQGSSGPQAGAILTGAIGQISRRVRDIKTAQHFYGDMLGLPHLYTFGTLAFFDCAGTRLMLTEGEGASAEAAPDQYVIYFSVPDINAAHAGLLDKGVTFVRAPHMIHRHDDGTEEWMAFFSDQDGHALAIMSAQPAPSESSAS